MPPLWAAQVTKLRDEARTFEVTLSDSERYMWEKRLGTILFPGDVVEVSTTLRDALVCVPEGTYRPQELGLYLDPAARWIHIGYCHFKQDKGIDGFQEKGKFHVAHAHAHPDTGDMCFINGTYIFEREGVVDETFLHEYCHILRGWPDSGDGHDMAWRDLMISYGLSPVRHMEYKYR